MPSSAAMAAVAAAGIVALYASSVKSVDALCDGLGEPELSWSATSNRIYVNGGCATISDLLNYRLDGNGKQKGPIWHFDDSTKWYSDKYTGRYLLEASIHIRNGATLSIDGRESETDECETLYLASNSTIFQEIRAHGGNLDIRYTKIVSWDLLAGTYDTNPDDGRSFISAITERITGRVEDTCPHLISDDPEYSSGRAKEDMGNANMDIRRSELAYLGYDAAESYGISYKARGMCQDLSNQDIYDDDNGLNYGVTGDIYHSDIHHNWFGHYSWGHDGGKWKYNTVHDNYGYGFDPHDDSDNIQIVENIVFNNGWHGIIASKRCTDILIKRNVVYGNGKNGIMLHRSCDRATVRDNFSFNNTDSGLAIYESSDCRVVGNAFEYNKNGIRWSNGANRNRVYGNTIRVGSDSKARFAFYMYKGNDETQAEGNDDGHPKNNSVWSNDIYSERDEVWKMESADSNVFRLNTFHGGAHATFESSVDNKVNINDYPDDWVFDVDENSCFRAGTSPEC